LTLQAQYQLTRFQPGNWVPTTSIVLQETLLSASTIDWAIVRATVSAAALCHDGRAALANLFLDAEWPILRSRLT